MCVEYVSPVNEKINTDQDIHNEHTMRYTVQKNKQINQIVAEKESK